MNSFGIINPRICVSGCIPATNLQTLKYHKIGLIVNCTKHVDFMLDKQCERTEDRNFSTYNLNKKIDDQPCYFDSQDGNGSNTFLIRRVRLPVEDNLHLDPCPTWNLKRTVSELLFMAKCLPRIVQLIYDYINENEDKNVLIHCVAGQQRSACVATAYLMKYHKMSLVEAIEFMRKQKKDAFQTGVNFTPSLIDFYENHLM